MEGWKVEENKLCILCCYLFKGGGGSVPPPRRLQEFRKFLEELEVDGGEVESMASGVCPECSGNVGAIVKLKGRMEGIEKNVRNLQREVLGKMKELRTCVEEFYEGLEGMKKTVKNSDFACLEGYVRNGRYSRRVMDVREKIANVARDLACFRQGLNTKLRIEDKLTPNLADVKYKPPRSPSSLSPSSLNEMQDFNTISFSDEDNNCSDQDAPPKRSRSRNHPQNVRNSPELPAEEDPIPIQSRKRSSRQRRSARDINRTTDNRQNVRDDNFSDGSSSDGENTRYLKQPMSPWKQRIIQDLLQPQLTGKTSIKSECEGRTFEFQSDTKTLTYAGVTVVLLEKRKCIGCSLCNFRTTQNPACFSISIRNHIDGRHANAVCGNCSATFTNLNMFRMHKGRCGKEPGVENIVKTEKRRKRKRFFTGDGGSSGDENESGEEDRDEDETPAAEDEWTPKEETDEEEARDSKSRRNSGGSKNTRKVKTPSILSGPSSSLKGLSVWRRIILKKIDKWKDGSEARSFWELTKGLEDQIAQIVENFEAPTSPSEIYRYDHKSGLLTCYSIPVILNDTEYTFQCSRCDYTTTPFVPNSEKKLHIHRTILKHIQGKHLRPLTCLHCGILIQGPRALATHTMTKHWNPEDASTCDICGKPLDKASIGTHKLTHMNAEEKAEALRLRDLKRKKTGKSVPPPPETPPTFPCSTCGKVFSRKFNLNIHEITHVPKEERESVLCPQCGKILLRRCLNGHLKFQCAGPSGGERPRVKCVHCESTLRNEQELKKHIERIHGDRTDVKPFQCSECGKAFQFKEYLRRHLKEIHHDKSKVDETWNCEKCGRIFFVKRYWREHKCKAEGC